MGRRAASSDATNFNYSSLRSTILLEQHLLLHFFQVKAGPADLIPISLSMSLTRHDLLKARPDARED